MKPTCCKCGRPVTNKQGYGWDKKRRLFWCEDCADPLPQRGAVEAAILKLLSWLIGLCGVCKK